jgi:hypothetical protein
MKRYVFDILATTFVVLLLSAPAYGQFVPPGNPSLCSGNPSHPHCSPGEPGEPGEPGTGGTGLGVGIGVAEATAVAGATAKVDNTNKNYNTNTNLNHNNNQQHQGQLQGQVQGQLQGQTQTATGGNAVAAGGSLNVGDTTLTTGPSTSSATGGSVVVESGAVTGTNTNNFSVSEGAVQNTNNNTAMGGAGGSVNVAEGAVQNSNTGTNTLNVAEGAVTAVGGVGGAGGSVNIEEGAVDNTSNASASTGDVTVNNNFGGEDGNGSLATQNMEGGTQIVEGSSTEVNVDARTDFRGAPVASVAPVFSTACSGGMSFQARDLGVSVGDAEYYCKLLQLADARYAQAQTILLIPPQPPIVSDCTGNVPDYTKGSRADTEMQKQATVSCFRQNQAAMEEYAVLVEAYNQASFQRTELLNQAYQLVNDAEDYVRSQRLTTNIGEQSRKLLYPALLIKTVAILFF